MRDLSPAALRALAYLGYAEPENAPYSGPGYHDQAEWIIRPADLVAAIDGATS